MRFVLLCPSVPKNVDSGSLLTIKSVCPVATRTKPALHLFVLTTPFAREIDTHECVCSLRAFNPI